MGSEAMDPAGGRDFARDWWHERPCSFRGTAGYFLSPTSRVAADKPLQLLVLSAKTPSALEKSSQNPECFLQETAEARLKDVAYTLQVGRKEFAQRRVVVASTRTVKPAVFCAARVRPASLPGNPPSRPLA